MEQIRYWNEAVEQKEFTTPFQCDVFLMYINLNASILDVGCGYGRTLDFLRKHGFTNLTGIDISTALIERGRRLYPELDLRTMKCGSIDFPDNSQDAIVLLAVLTCIARDQEQNTLMKEIARVLKPGGILYINDFLINSDERNQKRYSECPAGYPYGVFELLDGALLRHHELERIYQLCSPFEQLVFETCVYTTMNGHQSNGFYYIGKKVL